MPPAPADTARPSLPLVVARWSRAARGSGVVADADAECGRGLTVVAALADRWGWERTGQHRKVVWAELALCAPPPDYA